MTFQTRKIADLEDRSRRSNLIIHGIPESGNETEADLMGKIVDDIFKTKLDVKCTSIGRIHRIGKQPGKRPEIIHFQDFNEKKAIQDNATKRKGPKVFIQNDYSQSTLKKRRNLLESAKDEKDQGKKVYLVHDKPNINKELFVWNEAENKRVRVSDHTLQPTQKWRHPEYPNK